jgi:mono/diheme cytochrome c family protein
MKIGLYVAPFMLMAVIAAAQDDIGEGRKIFFKRCIGCHVTPDTSIRADETWIKSINKSA